MQAVSSATSAYDAAPDDVFTVLVERVFGTAVIKDIYEKILDIKGESDTIRLLGLTIRKFCSDLIEEGPNKLQSNSIRLLRRHYGFFAFEACRACKLSNGLQGEGTMYLSKEKLSAESNVEKYLREFSWGAASSEKYADSKIRVEAWQNQGIEVTDRRPENDIRNENLEKDFHRSQVKSYKAKSMNDSGDDESSSDSLDGEVESLPQSLTRETISWLTTGLSFQNFKNNLARSAYPPLEYVNRILEAALPTLEVCSAWFNIEWDLLDYVESELGDGQNLSTVLTLSGDGDNAYAASCLEYCVGIWPNTGEAVVRALETTIKRNRYRMYILP